MGLYSSSINDVGIEGTNQGPNDMYKYHYAMNVTGDPNTYYPVSVSTPSFTNPHPRANLVIMRRYWENGPAQLNPGSWSGSSTHQGGLRLYMDVNESSWSDMHMNTPMLFRYTYHNTISDYGKLPSINQGGAGQFWVRLRGSFTYHFYFSYNPGSNPARQETPGGVAYSTSSHTFTWPSTTTSVANSYFTSQHDGAAA